MIDMANIEYILSRQQKVQRCLSSNFEDTGVLAGIVQRCLQSDKIV